VEKGACGVSHQHYGGRDTKLTNAENEPL